MLPSYSFGAYSIYPQRAKIHIIEDYLTYTYCAQGEAKVYFPFPMNFAYNKSQTTNWRSYYNPLNQSLLQNIERNPC